MDRSAQTSRRLVAAALLAAASVTMVVDMAKAQGRAQRPADRAAGERTVTVSASGTLAAEPDIAHISTGVVSEADTAREALSRNTTAMKRVIDGLKTMGIDAKDIQTVSFNVEPRYPNRSTSSSGPPQIAGYRVVNQVRVTARNLDRLGEVLDQLVTLGANQMSGLSFEVSKADMIKDEARQQAVANALRRATLFARAAGAEVGAVLAISEDAAHIVPRAGPMARAALESVPIERGSQSLEVRVTVTWALR
jgi:hypothetical protein